MPDPSSAGAEPRAETDGRRRRGQDRRRRLIEAVLVVIGREGLSAVSQRSVAAQAGVPPSAVYYYFDDLDELVEAALADLHDRFVTDLDDLAARGGELVRELAVFTVESARRRDEVSLAELELWVLAARDSRYRRQSDRWNATLRTLAGRLSGDPGAVDAILAVLTGFFWLAATSDEFDAEQLEASLRRVLHGGPGSS